MKMPLPGKSIRPNRGGRFAGYDQEVKALGIDVAIEPGAGIKSGPAGFRIHGRRRTSARTRSGMPTHHQIIGRKHPNLHSTDGRAGHRHHGPYGNEAAMQTMADAGIAAFAME